MDDLYMDAEELLFEELDREPTFEEIEEKAIHMISSAIDRAYDDARDA